MPFPRAGKRVVEVVEVEHQPPAPPTRRGSLTGVVGDDCLPTEQAAAAWARSGDAVTITTYLGSSDALDRALANFAELYAGQNELDYASLTAAVKAGHVKAQTGR